jgi:Bacterial Ig-like domain
MCLQPSASVCAIARRANPLRSGGAKPKGLLAGRKQYSALREGWVRMQPHIKHSYTRIGFHSSSFGLKAAKLAEATRGEWKGSLKHLVVLIGCLMIGVLAAVFLMGADRVVPVTCGQDLDVIVNADDPTIGTRFQLEGPCTYTVDTKLAPKNGDEIAGPKATFIERSTSTASALDPEPTVTILGSEGLSNVIRAEGKVHLEWVKIVGGTGQYSGGSPVAGTGSALAMGMASNDSSLYAVHITGNDGAGITNAHGTFDSIELSDTTQDPNFLGFIGSGLKAITEVEVRNSYIHDNQGNGLWCDQFCHDSNEELHPNGFWIHHNLVVNNGRADIRFERVGDVADAGEALIENNEVHGNGTDATRGGIDIRDAQDAPIQNNRFGAATIGEVGYEVAYEPNANGVAIRATDSGRSDRPDLFNVDIVGNVLNGETIVGCEQPDEIVVCSDALPPPPPGDTTPPVITKVVTGTLGNNGWYTSNVGVDWSVSDAESAISSQSGCGDLSVTSDQQETTYTCTATSAGGTSTESVTIKRDATPPETTISPDSSSGTITTTTATFGFSSNETNSRFECKLDPVESAFSSCVSLKIYSSLANSSYTFSVQAIDATGNTDTSPATRSFTVSTTQGGDTTAPTVISTVPGPGATGVSPTINNVKATFSEAMMASSITGQTFMLFKNGSTTKIAAKVSYDPSTRTAKLNPTNNLQRGVTYRAVLTTGAKDVAGISLVQQKEWLFTVKR